MITNSEIADVLEEEAQSMPEHASKDSRKFEKRFGSFVVRCHPTLQAVESMAKKFRKRIRLTTPGTKLPKPTQGRKYNASTYDQFVLDGETHNAISYNQLHNRPVIFAAFRDAAELIYKQGKVQTGFAVGRVLYKNEITPWNVYHIDTGMTCSSAGMTCGESIAKFKKIKQEDLVRAVETNESLSGFQQRALANAQF